MKAGCTIPRQGGMAVLATIFAVFLAVGVAGSAEFHHAEDCTVCHDVSGVTTNDAVIAGTIDLTRLVPPETGTHDVTFPSGGTNDYVDEAGGGVCEACHTSTRHYKNDGTGSPHYPLDQNCFSSECHADHCGDPERDLGPFSGGMPDDAGHNFHTRADARHGGAITECSVCHRNSVYDSDPAVVAAEGGCDGCHSPGGAFNGVTMGVANFVDGVYEADGVTLKSGNEHWCAGCHDSEPAYSYSEVPAVSYIVVDNEDSEFVADPTAGGDSWRCKEQTGSYEGTRCHNSPGTGSATATWTPNLPSAGNYKVYARWVAGSSRATDAPYTINYNGGSVTVDVNQKIGGIDWEELTEATGPLPFAAGTSGSVVLSDDADGYVIADAVQFELQVEGVPVGVFAPDVIGDNTTYGFYKTGHNMDCLNCHDPAKAHIDHEHRTYDSLNDNYQDGYRLKSVSGGEPMNVPRKRKSDVYLVLDDFALCFSCHNYEEVLGEEALDIIDPWSDVSHTNFWNDGDFKGNLHSFHLEIAENKNTDSDFNGSGDTAPTCIGCHNVHGAPNQAMIRHGELINVNDKFPTEWAALNFSYLTDIVPPVADPTASLAASVGGILDWGGTTVPYNGVCSGVCHGLPTYERTPKLWPKVLTPRAEPSIISNNGSGSTLLTVVVSDPSIPIDFDPDNSVGSLEIDLSSIGGSSNQAMKDDGVPPDLAADDGIYSYEHDIPLDWAEGAYTLTVTATDSGFNTGTNVIAVSVAAPGVIVVDNSDPGFVAVPVHPDPDKWGCKADGGSYGIDGTRCHNSPGTGSATATWTFDIAEAGDYEVYAWWTPGGSRATDAPYTINYQGGSVTEDMNQKVADPSGWNHLTWNTGALPFAAGTYSIVLTDHADGYVIADAVRLEKQ